MQNEWLGEFGDEYTDRCGSVEAIKEQETPRRSMFDLIFSEIRRASRGYPFAPHFPVLEVGANVGQNIRAIAKEYDFEIAGVEPNTKAFEALRSNTESLCDFHCTGPRHYRAVQAETNHLPFSDNAFSLVFTAGVLIHVPPDEIDKAMEEIHRVSSTWIVAIEYFAPEEREVEYRGRSGMLWLRDYGSMYMDKFPDLELVSYGFLWKRATGMDNVTYWIFKK
jgi:spore coat polysaccharide biosynthesis protein SpsF